MKRKYGDLTLHQRISLKGEIQTNPLLVQYKAIMWMYGFVIAVEYFLNHDLSVLYRKFWEDIP